jgi:hypothetical protein
MMAKTETEHVTLTRASHLMTIYSVYLGLAKPTTKVVSLRALVGTLLCAPLPILR